MEEKRIVKPWQAGLMLLVGIALIIVWLLVMKRSTASSCV